MLRRLARVQRWRLSAAARAEYAIDYYLAASDAETAMRTRQSLREAAAFLASGVPAAQLLTPLAHVKADDTHDRLRAYRARLAYLARRGRYGGPTDLRRLRADGSWAPLRLPGD